MAFSGLGGGSVGIRSDPRRMDGKATGKTKRTWMPKTVGRGRKQGQEHWEENDALRKREGGWG